MSRVSPTWVGRVREAQPEHRHRQDDQALGGDPGQEDVHRRRDAVDDPPALALRGQQRGERVVDQHDVGDVAGDGAAAAHRHPDVGALERAGVVDAVADHGDVAALPAQRVDDPLLLLGGDPAEHRGAARRAGPARRRRGRRARRRPPARRRRSPARPASAATVRGSSPESTLSATPSARKPRDRLGDLGPQLVGQRDHARAAPAPAAPGRPVGVAQRGAAGRRRGPARAPAAPRRSGRPPRRPAAVPAQRGRRARRARRARTCRRRCAPRSSAATRRTATSSRTSQRSPGQAGGQRGAGQVRASAALRAIDPSSALDLGGVVPAERHDLVERRAGRWSACRSCRCRRRRRC